MDIVSIVLPSVVDFVLAQRCWRRTRNDPSRQGQFAAWLRRSAVAHLMGVRFP
jgi:hypothetical protein